MSKLDDYIKEAQEKKPELTVLEPEQPKAVVKEEKKAGQLLSRIEELTLKLAEEAENNEVVEEEEVEEPDEEDINEETFEPEVGGDITDEPEADEPEAEVTESVDYSVDFLEKIENAIMVENTKKREEVQHELQAARDIMAQADTDRQELMTTIQEQSSQINTLKKTINDMANLHKSVNTLVENVKRKERDLVKRKDESDLILSEAKQVLREAAGSIQYKTKIIDSRPSQVRIPKRDPKTGFIMSFVNEDGKTVATIKRDSSGNITQIVEKR